MTDPPFFIHIIFREKKKRNYLEIENKQMSVDAKINAILSVTLYTLHQGSNDQRGQRSLCHTRV